MAGGIADRVPVVVIAGIGLLVTAGIGLLVTAGIGLLVTAAVGARIIRSGVVLELDDHGFVDHRSGVRITWDEVERIQPRVRWLRGFRRVRALDLQVRDPSAVRDRITSRAGQFVVDRVPGGDLGQPSLGLNVIAADANDVVEAFERWSGRPIPERFTLTGLRRM